MRWLADENIPACTIQSLRRTGVDLSWVADGCAGMSDRDVLAWACREHRGILSFDRDFGELIYLRVATPPPAVVFLRFVPVVADDVSRALVWLFSNADLTLEGHFVTLSQDGARFRRLP